MNNALSGETKIDTGFIFSQRLTPMAKVAYLAMKSACDRNMPWSLKFLRDELIWSKRTVSRAIAELKSAGYIPPLDYRGEWLGLNPPRLVSVPKAVQQYQERQIARENIVYQSTQA